MGGFFAFFGTTLGKLVTQVAVTAALDIASALLSGGGALNGERLKNKSYRSDAYGTPWPRCRGSVRLQGKVLWGTNIVETTHKTTSGGLFGLGSTSTYYYTYSVSMFVGFGKKLGGTAAKRFLRIYLDGKILYSALVNDATIKGTVEVTAAAGSGQDVSLALWPEGATSIPIATGSASSIVLNTGDVIAFRWFNGDGEQQPLGDVYTVQAPVNLGPNQTGAISVFPALGPDPRSPDDNHSEIFIAVPGLNTPLFDVSSFDPDPHDGSHLDSTPVGPGGIRFYLGSDTQLPDPLIVKKLGAGNAPGYRGTVGAMIYNLQLANYGNHIPAPSAEISFDDASDKFPVFGPVALGASLSTLNSNFVVVPGAYYPNAAASVPNPPKVVAIQGVTPPGTSKAYVVNSNSNLVLVSDDIPAIAPSFFGAAVADADYLYFIGRDEDLHWIFYKYNLSDLKVAATVSGAEISEPAIGGLKLYDVYVNFFGKQVLKQMAVYSGQFGSITLVDRHVDTSEALVSGPLGNILAIPIGGMAIASHAETPSEGFTAETPIVAVTNDGEIWVAQGTKLVHYSGAFSNGFAPNVFTLQPEPVLIYPSLNTVGNFDLSATLGSGPIKVFFYDPVTNSFFVAVDGLVALVDLAGNVTGTSAVTTDMTTAFGSSPSPILDFMGSALLETSTGLVRVNAGDIGGALTPTTYDLANWIAGLVGNAGQVYDPQSDSLWLVTSDGKLMRLYLDRGAGAGVSEDVIAAAIHAEAGYSHEQYNVDAFAAFSVLGVEFDQETYKQDLSALMGMELVDGAEIDGQIKYIDRARAPIITIPEDDLGASDGGDPAPRLEESLQEETEVPASVWLKYYDPLKQYQQATQYQKRISQPYASDLLDALKVVHSRTQAVISIPVTDNATPMKQRADKMLFDRWAARNKYAFKTSVKYLRLDPTDPIAITYKGETLLMRLLECDRGAQLALEFRAESYDRFVYSNTAISSDSGAGSGDPATGPPPVPPVVTPPAVPPVVVVLLGSSSDLTVDITAPSGAEDGFTVAHALGETPSFAVIAMFTGGNIWFDASRYDGTTLYLKGSAAGVVGKAYLFKTAPKQEIALAPTAEGDFQAAHTLAAVPGMVLVQMTSGGNIWSQPSVADSALAYFTASDADVTAKAGLWLALIGVGSPSVRKIQIPLLATADGNFEVAHGLGTLPKNVFIHMHAPGFPAFWFQSGVSGAPDGFDATKIYLVSPGANVAGFAEVLY